MTRRQKRNAKKRRQTSRFRRLGGGGTIVTEEDLTNGRFGIGSYFNRVEEGCTQKCSVLCFVHDIQHTTHSIKNSQMLNEFVLQYYMVDRPDAVFRSDLYKQGGVLKGNILDNTERGQVTIRASFHMEIPDLSQLDIMQAHIDKRKEVEQKRRGMVYSRGHSNTQAIPTSTRQQLELPTEGTKKVFIPKSDQPQTRPPLAVQRQSPPVVGQPSSARPLTLPRPPVAGQPSQSRPPIQSSPPSSTKVNPQGLNSFLSSMETDNEFTYICKKVPKTRTASSNSSSF